MKKKEIIEACDKLVTKVPETEEEIDKLAHALYLALKDVKK